MEKTNSKPVGRVNFFWGAIIVLLLVAIALINVLRETEESLRVSTQKQLAGAQRNLVKVVQAIGIERGKSEVLRIELDQKKREVRITLNQLEAEMVARRQAEIQLVKTLEEKTVLGEKMKAFAKTPRVIELEKIIVEPVTDSVGEVSEVNKKYGFIVANLGRKNNLKIGDILSVYRNKEIIGKAQVERVENDFCAAAILSDWQDVDFKKNDLVKIWK